MHNRRLSFAFGLAIFAGACAQDGGSEGSFATNGGAPLIRWEQFRDSAVREPWEGGRLIVDGDIVVKDEDALRAYYDELVPRENALTVNLIYGGVDDLWSYPDRFHLTYCVSEDFGALRVLVVDAMARASASWSDFIGVDFTYDPTQDADCNAANENVTFDVRFVEGDSNFAYSFPPSYDRELRELLVYFGAFTTSEGGRDLEGILRHELGHILGFRHEHIWIGCTTEGPEDARFVTFYDVNSVMHYPQCRPSGSGGYRQSTLDYVGSRLLYGTAPALTLAATSSML